MSLPVVVNGPDLAVVDPDTGELVPFGEASDRALLEAASRLAEHDRQVFMFKRALAAELHQRHGIGTVRAGGFRFKVNARASWPQGETSRVLDLLVRAGHITQAEADRCMPSKPSPSVRQLNALASRLARTNPEAATILSGACSVSPPALSDLEREAVEGSEP